MKKFLGKKAVMWSFLGAAVAFLVLYVCLLVRPVTTLTPYKGEYMGEKASYTFVGGNKLKFEINGQEEGEYWVAYDLYSFCAPGAETNEMTRKEFLEEIDKYKETYPQMYEKMLTDVNAFRIKATMGTDTVTLTNAGAIVFAVVGGLVEAGLVTFAVLSFLTRKKKA